jgi:hypothetical protein
VFWLATGPSATSFTIFSIAEDLPPRALLKNLCTTSGVIVSVVGAVGLGVVVGVVGGVDGVDGVGAFCGCFCSTILPHPKYNHT